MRGLQKVAEEVEVADFADLDNVEGPYRRRQLRVWRSFVWG